MKYFKHNLNTKLFIRIGSVIDSSFTDAFLSNIFVLNRNRIENKKILNLKI